MVLHLRNSRIEFSFDVVIHSGALLALTQIDAALVGLIMGACLISFSFVCAIRRYTKGCASRIEEIRLSNGAWELLIGGCWVESLKPDIRFFSEYFIVLQFKNFKGKGYDLLLFPDSLKREELLRLRKYLRFDYSTT